MSILHTRSCPIYRHKEHMTIEEMGFAAGVMKCYGLRT